MESGWKLPALQAGFYGHGIEGLWKLSLGPWELPGTTVWELSLRKGREVNGVFVL